MLKSLFCSTLLLFAISAIAQAQEPVPLARGNTPGEPHHHLKIENEYVRVYYVEAPPHEATLLHQHDHDYIYVSLGPSDVVNAIVNKPEIHLQLKDGETHFTRGGFAHVARNLADTPFRNITIELLKPQGDAHNLCAQVLLGSAAGECPGTGDEKSFNPLWVQFETSEMSLRLLQIGVGPETIATDPEFSSLLVALDGAQIQVGRRGKPRQDLTSGGMIWLERKSIFTVHNLGREPSRYLWFSFRD